MKHYPRAAILTCILMTATFLEMSAFFFLYELCPLCLLSMAFILTYWICLSAINMTLGILFIILTGEMPLSMKRTAALVGSLVLVTLLALVSYATCKFFA